MGSRCQTQYNPALPVSNGSPIILAVTIYQCMALVVTASNCSASENKNHFRMYKSDIQN